jgi:hypothetical protein
MKKEQV